MHNKFNDFILSITFDVNEFNVGKNYERAYIVLFKYREWITNNFTSYKYVVNKVQFENIIDQLYLNEFNGKEREYYANLKQLSSEEYSINLISIYKLFLISKVRTRQIGNSDLEISLIQDKLAKIFSPIEWDEKTKQEVVLDRDLPKINKNENSSKGILPISLLILGQSLTHFFSSSTFVLVLQIFIFLVVGGMCAKLIKNQKSEKDIDELKAWDYIVNNGIGNEV